MEPSPVRGRLTLKLQDAVYPALAPQWSPVRGQIQVVAGQTYRVEVYEGQNWWDSYGDPFVLTISLE